MIKKDIQFQSLEGQSSSSETVQKLNLCWRVLATALGFSMFGIGGIILSLSIFPILILVSKNADLRSNRVRTVIRYTFRLYLWMLEFLGVLKIETKGLENLQNMQGKLVICNHPSLLDVVIIMSRLRNVQCVVNNKLWRHPIVGFIVRAARYIRNDIEPELFLENCKAILERGENIIIFPEGTRSVPGKPIKLLRGFANLALCANSDIQALTLLCQPATLIKGAKWYDVPPRRANFLLEVGPQFKCKDQDSDSPRSLRVRALVRDIQQYYDGYLKI